MRLLREEFQSRWLLGIHCAHTNPLPTSPTACTLHSKVPSNTAGHQARTWQILIEFTPLAPAVAEPQGKKNFHRSTGSRPRHLEGSNFLGPVCTENLANWSKRFDERQVGGLARCSGEGSPPPCHHRPTHDWQLSYQVLSKI